MSRYGFRLTTARGRRLYLYRAASRRHVLAAVRLHTARLAAQGDAVLAREIVRTDYPARAGRLGCAVVGHWR